MKILKTGILMFVLLGWPVYAIAANLGYMRINLIEGDVQIKTPAAEDWGIAAINEPVGEGDQVWAPEGGRVELQLNSGTYIRLNENSALQILSMDKESSQFYLSQGGAYIYYGAAEGSVIQVDTPEASTRAFDRAIFRLDMSEKYTDVAVYKGYVETENMAGETKVMAGQMVSLGENTDGELGPIGSSDDWEIWNKARNDRILAGGGVSSGYLPIELRAYSYDLDNSGRWVEDLEYGYVWTPIIVVGAQWAPYRHGRWIWRGNDYVWVGSEPWGWAPYHYGRWSFGARIGWFWVPPVVGEVHWGPGYVGWVRTGNYVAWVPLAPREIYYGRGNYGQHSVNITTVNFNQVNITNVYKNVNVINGVTVVNQKTFATASPRIVKVNHDEIRQKIFVISNISIGTPAIKPTKASSFASARSVPAAKRPPQAVREVQITRLKQARPLIREADKSVLNHGIKPKNLPVKTVTTPRHLGKGKSIKQVKPGESLKPSTPAGGPINRTEKPQIKSDEKGEAKESQDGPINRAEKRLFNKQKEKGKPEAAQGGPTGRADKQQAKRVKREPAPAGGPAVIAERKPIKLENRKKEGALQIDPTAGDENHRVERPRRVNPSDFEGGSIGRDERRQFKPHDDGKTAVQ